MLNIVPSCNLVQYQGKLMNQTCKNDKKPNFGPDFGPFGPNLGPKKFFRGKFFSVITKNLNWEILTKNLVTFKRRDGVKDEKF